MFVVHRSAWSPRTEPLRTKAHMERTTEGIHKHTWRSKSQLGDPNWAVRCEGSTSHISIAHSSNHIHALKLGIQHAPCRVLAPVGPGSRAGCSPVMTALGPVAALVYNMHQALGNSRAVEGRLWLASVNFTRLGLAQRFIGVPQAQLGAVSPPFEAGDRLCYPLLPSLWSLSKSVLYDCQ